MKNDVPSTINSFVSGLNSSPSILQEPGRRPYLSDPFSSSTSFSSPYIKGTLIFEYAQLHRNDLPTRPLQIWKYNV